MVERSYDVVVVGAGPAGSAAAYHLAAHGFSTLLVDRQRFPRDKACGDALGARAVRALVRMGLERFVAARTAVQGYRFIEERSGRRILMERRFGERERGAVIPRRVLDDRLRRRAESVGVDFSAETAATRLAVDAGGRARGVWIEREGDQRLVAARIAVIADGAAGMLGRCARAQATPESSPPAFAMRQYWIGVEGLEPLLEIRLPLRWQGRALVGYAWVFPVDGTMANVGLGFIRGPTLDAPSLAAIFHAFTDELGRRDPRFRNARPSGAPAAGVVGLRMADPEATPRGVVLVGDAARLVNPFTGEGIAYALESGELAARSIALALRHRRGVATVYARQLRAAYPRHRTFRHSAAYLQWLAARGLPYGRAAAASSVAAALWRCIADEPTNRSGWSELIPPTETGARIGRRLEATRQGVVAAVRATDPMLGELLDYLLEDPAPAVVVPILVGHAIAARRGRRSELAGAGIEAIALFALAHGVLDQTVDGPEEETHAGNTLAILLGDVLAAEGMRALRRLPAATSRRIVAALADAAWTRLGRDAAMRRGLETGAARVASAAAAAVCLAGAAASLHGLGGPRRDRVTAFARWFAATACALGEFRRDPDPALRRHLQQSLDAPAALLERPAALRELSVHVRAQVEIVLASATGEGPRVRAAR